MEALVRLLAELVVNDPLFDLEKSDQKVGILSDRYLESRMSDVQLNIKSRLSQMDQRSQDLPVSIMANEPEPLTLAAGVDMFISVPISPKASLSSMKDKFFLEKEVSNKDSLDYVQSPAEENKSFFSQSSAAAASINPKDVTVIPSDLFLKAYVPYPPQAVNEETKEHIQPSSPKEVLDFFPSKVDAFLSDESKEYEPRMETERPAIDSIVETEKDPIST